MVTVPQTGMSVCGTVTNPCPTYLWCHVAWSPNLCAGKVHSCECFCHSKITNLEQVVLAQEDVGWLDVPVDNVVGMKSREAPAQRE